MSIIALSSTSSGTGFDFVAIADGHPDDKQTQDALALLTGSRGGEHEEDKPNWAKVRSTVPLLLITGVKVLGCFHVNEENR